MRCRFTHREVPWNWACSPLAEAQNLAMLGETQQPILPDPVRAECMRARKKLILISTFVP